MGEYHYTDKYYYYYDQTLTQGLLDQYVSTINPANSSGTHFVYLNNAGTMSAFTGSRHTPNPEVYSGEAESATPSTQTSNYENFTAAVNVNFAEARSAASGFGSARAIPNGITLMDDNTYAANITFANGGDATAEGNDTRFTDLTFTDGGTVYLGWVYDEGEGNQTRYYATTGQRLSGLRGKLDFDELYLQTGASASATDVVISRNMRTLNIANDSGNRNVENRTGNGTVVDSVTVSGKLDRVHVGSGASLNMLTVGLQRSFTSADRSAFGYFNSNWNSWTYSSATIMEIASGGTASNIYLNNGGTVTVFGPEDRVSSTWVEDSNGGHYNVTTSYASGAGGVLTNLQMAMSGGLQFDGISDPAATWQESNGVYWSADYRSHHRAAAPQSAYVEFQSNTSGSNVTIGNGGSMRIGKGASVVGISMGALVTSTFHTSGGKQMTWVGDRGAKLTIDGGFASNVAVEGAPLTRDYFFAVNNGFSTLSSSIQRDYYDSHGSYLDDKVASASAAAGYNAFMSSRYNSVSQELYDARYLGGEIIVNGGTLLNASRFAYLYAGDNPDWTFTSSGVSMTARIGEMVSKATGALSATVEVDGAAHVTSITVAGGRFVMGANSGGVARWAGQSNAQSNYAQAEYINLRTSGLEGDNHSAMVLFGGANYSGQHSEPVMSNGSQVHDSNGYNQWTYYDYECMDPGEIHYLTGDKGLIVKDLGWGGQDFTYTGSGATTINGLGTVVLSGWHSRACSDSYYGKGPYLKSATNQYYFGVVKGVYDESSGKLQAATILNGEGGFDWKGTLVVGSGGIVQDVGSQAGLKTGNTLTSDSWNPVIENDASKILVLVAGGSADNVTVTGRVTNYEITSSSLYRGNAALLVSSGATATNVRVLSNGMAMAEGGVINGVYVGNGGLLYLSGWAGAHQVSKDAYGNELAGPQYLDETVLNGVRLDSGGQLTNTLDWGFRTGGHAPSVIANAGGGVMNGVTANGVAYVSGLDYAGAITLTNGQQGIDLTVRGFNTITSRDAEGKPLAYTTTIASLNVSSGGIVKGATVGDEGAIYVSEGADVSGLTASGGRIIFAKENPDSYWTYLPGSATVNGITVKDGGSLQVNSKFGLTATNMKIEQDAGLEFTLGDTASEDYTPTELNGTWTADWGGGTFYTDDGTMSGFGGQFGHEYRDLFYSSAYVSARLSMTVAKGGILTGADLRGYGGVRVTSGGKIFNTHLRGITANIGASGYVSGLTATTESTGSAYDTNIYVYGSGAVADDTVLSGGFLGVENSAVVNSVTLMAPEGYNGPKGDTKKVGPAEMEILGGGRANNVVASAGVVTIYNGSYKEPGMAAATLSNADIHSAATLVVNDDGVVLDGTLNLGGTVVTTAERYEWIEVEVTDPDTGDVYTDWQRVTKNNSTADASTLTVNFDLTERNGSEEEAMIDNLANLQGATLGTITVSADQAEGQYVLAQGAEAFTGTISVNVGSSKLADFSAGTIWQYTDDTVFMLTNNANMGLTFTVQNSVAAVENIIATVGGQELLKGRWTNQAVTIKTSVNQYTKSIWYKIRKAVATRGTPSDDGWTQLDNENGLVISEYCDVDFMALDANGRQSRVVTCTVNYDAAAAVIGDFRSDATAALYEGDQSQVSVTVTDDHDQAPTVELLSGADWVAVNRNDTTGRYAFTVSGNGEYTLRATDHAGNVSTQVVTVDFYTDVPTEPPTVVSATPSTTDPTNQSVTVTAVFSSNASTKQYSLDGNDWLDYTGPVTMETNGSVYFRASNPLGDSDVTEVVVDNIDRVAPEAPTAAANTTDPTCQGVIIIVTYSEDSTTREYSFDGRNWLAYDAQNGVTAEENGTVYFRGIDAAGNVSEVTEYAVTNIDRIPPEAPAAAADVTELTAGGVTVTASFTDDSTVREYSFDGQNWQAYAQPVVMADNGTVYFRGIDAAGNVSEVTGYTVGNIVKDRPPRPEAQADITALTNQNVTVSAVFSNTAAAKQYSFDGTGWLDYTGPVTMEQNGSVFFRAWNPVGYSEMTEVAVANIDKVPPAAPVASADVTEETPGPVTVSAVFSGDSVLREYSLDGNAWSVYTDDIVLRDNAAVSFRGTDAAGNVSDVVIIVVNNIAPNTYEIGGEETGSQAIDLQFSGKYVLTGEFGADANGTVTLVNGKKKFSGSVKNGKLSFNDGKPVLLDNAFGTELQVKFTKGSARNYTATLSPEVVFDRIDNSDDWTEFRTRGPAGDVDNTTVGVVGGNRNELFSGWVGYGDRFDYKAFTLENTAKLVFDVTASESVKFTVLSLTANSNGTYDRKSLQSSALSKTGDGIYSVTTKELLLEAGTYYIGVENPDAANGGNADYTVAVNRKKSVFFTQGDDGSNNWLYDGKAKTVNRAVTGAEGIVIDAGTGSVALDMTPAAWVGSGDAVDFSKITLTSAAKLSFTVKASDAAKFTVYSLTANANGTYTQKSLQSSSLSKPRGAGTYSVTTKELLLEAGDYYLAVESTNASKGGNAGYTVAVNRARSTFYNHPDSSNADDDFRGTGVIDLGGIPLVQDSAPLTAAGWVGFGDAVDYRKFVVAEDMKVIFDVAATDAVSLAIYQLQANGKLSGAKQTTKFKANSAGTTAALSLKAGTYYVAVKSTNAAKGGSAEYTISGSRYVEPLKLTVGENTGNVSGTWYADTVTFKGDRGIKIGTMELGDGNDRVVLEKSRGKGRIETGDMAFGAGNDSLTLNAGTGLSAGTLDFGAGNDTFRMNADADFSGAMVDFGAGNDSLLIGKNADCFGDVLSFGAGNDRMRVGANSIGGSFAVSFGNGDDALTVDKGGRFRAGSLDFGAGNDSLILNGTLLLDSGAAVAGLKKVSGSGQLLLAGGEVREKDFRMFTAAGIDVVNVIDAYSDNVFTDKKTELADNSRDHAAVLREEKDKNLLSGDFWLCGEDLADSLPFGFADDTDCFRFAMQSKYKTLSIDFRGAVSGELTDAEGNVLAAPELSDAGSCEWDLTGLSKGQYYLRLSVASDAFAVGQVRVS